jgi:hypothetical protein
MVEVSLEGWIPEPGVPLGEVIEKAFDYRGNVTVLCRDDRVIIGYLCNRDAHAAEPFVEIIDASGDGPFRVPYAAIQTIRFTGKDPAAGNSYAAWLERKAAAKAEGKPAPQR